ncbi:MAG: tRNA (guanosine(37)-N1)-methyltransferase TrmD [Magnetococcales bacterium]|nr:tRNA (guanosine(37)-N1)-methyltransferase TrmD [Magnetococcales bacterium]NGZ26921.1 tRNA (guanosine(37)-N1)-methyltransferase TrmD [Magnetococcales bacterium]
MRFTILTLFPAMFDGPFQHSMLARAQEKGLLDIQLLAIRDFAHNRHQQVDDSPYGGGPGMVMKADVLETALQHATRQAPAHVVMMTPQGAPFRQADAFRLAALDHVVVICGHYEGVDERFVQKYADEQLSMGDFVLTGGEIAAMALVDAVARLIPGVLGDPQSCHEDSFGQGILDHPHYTRPAQWQGMGCPPVLTSGDHGAVAAWRRRQALLTTLIRRPDLLAEARLDKAERRLLNAFRQMLMMDEDGTC